MLKEKLMSALKRKVTVVEGDDQSSSTKVARPTKRKIPAKLATMSQVKKLIASSRETKIDSTGENAVGILDSTLGTVFSWPEPSVGTRDDQRVGNVINPVFMEHRYLFHNTSTTNGFMIRVLTLQSKQGSGLTNTEALNALFESSAGGTVAPDPDLDAMVQRVNKELFVVKDDIVHELGFNGSGAPISQNVVRRHTFKPVSVMKFDEPVSNTPVANKYITVVIARLTTNQAPGTESVQFTNERRMFYKD